MRIDVILRYTGIVILLAAAFMLLAALVSLAHGPDSAFYPLLLSAVITASLGSFPLIFVGKSGQLTMKEGYMIVVLAWIVACVVGMFPYLLWGGGFTFVSAWFESVSGFTATGASAIADLEQIPLGLLFWRSSTNWLGGVGVVMFALIILPSLGRSKLMHSSGEISSLARENYRYRAQKVVQILLLLYVGMTVAETILLKIAGMGWFDAINHAFTTISTAGFSTHNESIAWFDNRWIELIIIIFMLLSGVHFGLLFATITGKHNNIFRSEVTRFYFATTIVAVAAIVLSIWLSGVYPTFGESLRRGLFQAVSTITTTAFSIADTNLWTPLAIAVLVYLMFQCACAGSTSGGIKSDRVWLALKVLKAKVLQQQHPNAVIRIKLDNMVQDNSIVNFAMFFIVLYLLLVVIGTLVITATGVDIMTGFSMSAASLGNIGTGFGEVGTVHDYAHVSPFVKTFCTLLMLLGRLEIFGLIQLFMIKWWR